MLELAAPQSPAPDEVVIAVRAAGVGNWDEIVQIGDCGRVPGARAHRRPGAQRGRAGPERESALVHGAGGVTGGLVVQLATPNRCCDSRPRESGARQRLWRDCGLRLSRPWLACSRAGGIARRTRRRGGREHRPRRRQRDQAVADGGLSRQSPAIRPDPNEESRSPTSRSAPIAHGLPRWSPSALAATPPAAGEVRQTATGPE